MLFPVNGIGLSFDLYNTIEGSNDKNKADTKASYFKKIEVYILFEFYEHILAIFSRIFTVIYGS